VPLVEDEELLGERGEDGKCLVAVDAHDLRAPALLLELQREREDRKSDKQQTNGDKIDQSMRIEF
jgi:hypothetical protein